MNVWRRKGEKRVPIVRASCAACGDVELPARGVKVLVCTGTGATTYAFQCPRCRLIVSREAEPRAVELLRSAGVDFVRWDLPGELSEIKEGPPITHDELLSFHFEVAEDGWLGDLIARTRGGLA